MTFNNKTIEELHNLLASKEISATELTQATLEDIKSREEAINAFVTIAEEQALAKAQAIDDAGIDALEKELLAQNATHKDWCCTTDLMAKTAHGMDTIYMHPLPADINGVSCEHGEVENEVFDYHRDGLYKEASYKPYAIAAMIFLQKAKDPIATLKALEQGNTPRWLQA